MLPNYLILRKMIGVGFAETVAALRPAMLVSLLLSAVGFVVVAYGFSNPLAQFCLVGASLGTSYFTALRFVAPEALRELVRLLRRKRGKSA